MAYSSVRVQFEIGHEASVRTKKTPDGFTHDWEVFVKGADNTDIQYFVEKVVFHLHETFPKPRRVIKEPPYIVKESGYAGFVLPIDVYLKNKEEPKKISFQYDLTLQNSGPPISRVLREPRVFQNPSEDFRRKLIRGGGVGVDTPSEVPTEEHKPSSSLGLSKSKPIESPSRKHKPELKLNDSFAELFGPPIRRITPEPKKISDFSRKMLDSDKDKKKLPKSHKEEKEAPKEKEKYADRDRMKERDKSKDKLQKTIVKPKEEHKKHEEKEKKKEDYDEKKKRKEDREKKEKHKESKELEKQEVRKEKKEPRESNDYIKKLNSSKSHENRAPNDKISTELEKERSEKEKHKHRHKKKEKEKNREKERHKKDKEKNDHDSRERNREKDKINKKRHDEGKDREKKKSRTPSPLPEKMKKGPLNALLVELGNSDSASPLSEDEDSIPSFKSASKAPAKVVPENKTTVNLSPKLKSTNLNEKDAEKHQKVEEVKSKRDKSPCKKSKKNDMDAEKRRMKEHRRRSTSSDKDEEEEKVRREEVELFEKEQAEKERLFEEEEKAKQSKKEKESNRKRKREKVLETKFKKNAEAENSVSASQAESMESQDELRKTEKFTKEYFAQLRDLQHRIMTLEDNDDLQKVVQVIAETGQYEITKQTFDFDLCALDIDTIRRLQEFFAPT